MKLFPYKPGSASAKALANSLGIKRVKPDGPLMNKKQVIINWGASRFPDRIANNPRYNDPWCVERACDKLAFFKKVEGEVQIPEFTDNMEFAKNWGTPVVCRTVLNGHSGKGIVLANTPDEIVKAPLYTKYKKKTHEFRLHVFQNEVFFIQKKMRKLEVPDEDVNWQIRNHQNGFIYANQNIEVCEDMKRNAITTIQVLGLDFGAVDVIQNDKGDFWILEVNTAPGLTGTTLDKYVEVFRRLL